MRQRVRSRAECVGPYKNMKNETDPKIIAERVRRLWAALDDVGGHEIIAVLSQTIDHYLFRIDPPPALPTPELFGYGHNLYSSRHLPVLERALTRRLEIEQEREARAAAREHRQAKFEYYH